MVYKLPLYLPGLAAAVGMIAAAVAVLLLWKRKLLVLALLASGLAVFSGVLLAPMLALDRVVLDDEKLEQTTGFWFAPTVQGFRFADVDSIEIGTAHNDRNWEYEVWIVKGKNGKVRRIDPGDLWELNGPDIIARLRTKGIQVTR
jgi:hypothetical protein